MRFDVVVIGAGTAGAAAAWHCASRGLRVLCLDRRPLGGAGARWMNGVALWQLDEAGFPRPEGADARRGDGPVHLVAGWGPERVLVTGHEVVDMDMRALVEDLQRRAKEAGAELRGGVEVRDFDGRSLRTSEGEILADTFLDASGLRGAGLVELPAIAREHLCAAAQGVYEVTDPGAARAFFEENGVGEGEILCFTGVEGGYSILNLRMHEGALAILTGSVPAEGHASGKAMLDRFVAEHAWVGAERFGGARAIPIRRPLDRLTYGRVALVGDSASQVFPAHGSGVAQGMIAARILAETLAAGRPLTDYAARYQRRWGALLAAYDVFRRYSQGLALEETKAMMSSALFDPRSSAAAMAQRWPTWDPTAAGPKLGEALRDPRRSATLLKVLAKMGGVAALYRAYPASEGRRLRAWSRSVAALMGEPADL